MHVIEGTEGEFQVRLSREEMLILHNALNEVVNGIRIEDWEFQTRMGVEREEAAWLLHEVQELLRTTMFGA
jgi:hypothetical protein